MERTRVSTGTEWEERVGYSRAVRAGNQVNVSGTTATDDDGDLVGEADPYAQARQALDNVASALAAVGASVEDVVRTRLYVADADDWVAVGRAHAEVFGDVRPTTSMVEVSGFVDPAMLVEVEAVALVDE